MIKSVLLSAMILFGFFFMAHAEDAEMSADDIRCSFRPMASIAPAHRKELGPLGYSTGTAMFELNDLIFCSKKKGWNLKDYLIMNACDDHICDRGSSIDAIVHIGVYTIFKKDNSPDPSIIVAVADPDNHYRRDQPLRGYYYRWVKFEHFEDKYGFVTDIPVLEPIK